MTSNLFLSFLATSLALIPLSVMAAALRVAPAKLVLDERPATASLKMTNVGDEPVSIQVEVVAWEQDAQGVDSYTATKDIVFFPKIFSFVANEEQIIRIGYRGEWPSREKPYFIYLTELPVAAPGEPLLKMVFRIRLPTFVGPVKATQERSIEIEQVALSAGRLVARVKNSGNNHFTVQRIRAAGLNETGTETFSREIGGWYVLPGVSKPFLVDLSAEECLKASVIQVTVTSGKLSLEKT